MEIFYLVMFLINMLGGAVAVAKQEYHFVYLFTISAFASFVFYAERAWGLLK